MKRSTLHGSDARTTRPHNRHSPGRDIEEKERRRREWMIQQERERVHERLKKKKIEEWERKRRAQEEGETKSHKGRSSCRSTSGSRSASPGGRRRTEPQPGTSKSSIMSEKFDSSNYRTRLFKGPEGTKIDVTHLRRIKVDIIRNLVDPGPSNPELQREILDPEDVKVKRREGEGAKPIFERDELKTREGPVSEVEEHRTVVAVNDCKTERKSHSTRKRSASPTSSFKQCDHNSRREIDFRRQNDSRREIDSRSSSIKSLESEKDGHYVEEIVSHHYRMFQLPNLFFLISYIFVSSSSKNDNKCPSDENSSSDGHFLDSIKTRLFFRPETSRNNVDRTENHRNDRHDSEKDRSRDRRDRSRRDDSRERRSERRTSNHDVSRDRRERSRSADRHSHRNELRPRSSREVVSYREHRDRSMDDSRDRRSRNDRSGERRALLPHHYAETMPVPLYYDGFHPRPIMVGPMMPMHGQMPMGRGRMMGPLRPPFPPRFIPHELYRPSMHPNSRFGRMF